MARNVFLTDEQLRRREDLRSRAEYLGALLHPTNLTALRAEQGRIYRELRSLGDGREDLARRVGLASGKSIDWAINKAAVNAELSAGHVVVSTPEDMARAFPTAQPVVSG